MTTTLLNPAVTATEEAVDEISLMPWRFVEKFYPGYYKCDEIAHSNDLHQILTGELESESAKRVLKQEYFGDQSDPRIVLDHNAGLVKIYEKAMSNYLKVMRVPF